MQWSIHYIVVSMFPPAPLVPPEEEADEWEVAAVRVPPAPLVPPEEEADEWEVAVVRVPPASLVPQEEEADEWEVAAVRVPPASLVPPEEEADEWEVAAVCVPPAPLVPPEEEADEWEVPCGSSNHTLPTAQPDPHQNTLDLHTDDHHKSVHASAGGECACADSPMASFCRVQLHCRGNCLQFMCMLSCSDYLLERAEDYLVADDPALLSDEFSEPEEWGFG